MQTVSESWLGEVVGRPEVERDKRGNSIRNSVLNTERDSVWLRRRVQESVMGQGKVCGHDPKIEGLRREPARAFISQRSWGDKGTRQ